MPVTFGIAGTTATLTGALTVTGAVTVTSGSITGITDLTVADGGTGVSTLTDGGILLGSGTGAITAMAVLAAGELIYGDGTTDPAILAAGATTTILVGGGAAAPVWTTATGTGAPARAGSPTFTGTVTTAALTVTGALTFTSAGVSVNLSPGTTGSVTINPNTLGNIDNTRIGFTTRAAIQCTTLAVNSSVTMNADAAQDSVQAVTPFAQLRGTNFAGAAYLQARYSADAGAPSIHFAKSRNASAGSHTLVQANDQLGVIFAYGSNGTSFDLAASILFLAGTTPGASADMPGIIAFNTSPDGSATLTERLRITEAGQLKIAGTATRATTEGSNHLDIFDGTAPVGTLTNGISLYSTAGELRVMDSGGTATLLSPHDDENYWIFDSVDTTTGNRLYIDVEKLLRFVNNYFGLDFVKDFTVKN